MKLEPLNYGTVLATGLKAELLAYKEYGSYQGDWIAILKTTDDKVEIFKGNYGSCPGCDWLEDNSNWDGEISEESVTEFCRREGKPFLELDSRTARTIVEAEDPSKYFPANTREKYNDWDWEDMKRIISEALAL